MGNSFLRTLFSKYTLAVLLPLAFLFSAQPVAAQSKDYSLENIEVEIAVNADSSMQVSEEITYHFNDEFNGMFREITLDNPANSAQCDKNPNLTCGGFDYINIDKVSVDGEVQDESGYDIYETFSGGESRLRVQHEFPGAPIRINNEIRRFKVEYTVWGGIGFFPEQDYALFYWNTIFADRDREFKQATVKITFPNEYKLATIDNQVLPGLGVTYKSQFTDHSVIYQLQNVPPQQNFTVLQKIDLDAITAPGRLLLNLDPSTQTVTIGDFPIGAVEDKSLILGVPAGKHTVKFENGFEYESAEQTITVNPDQSTEVTSVLEMSLLGTIKLILTWVLNIGCCLGALLIPLLAYLYWRRRGKDPEPKEKVVTPKFKAPEGIRPYLLGSIKDEAVDPVDITAMIIDFAYRGYLKIIEEKSGTIFKKTEYNLQKLKEPEATMPTAELEIFTALFADSKQIGDTVSLTSIKTRFYSRLPGIKEEIYQEMQEKGYFVEKPENVRKVWMGGGIAVGILLGVVGFVVIPFGVCSLLPAAIVFGITALILGRYMPRKTQLGADTLNDIRGFKMYLETAEKYRVQNLTPETFEKFLPYAMVFGIEEQWAEKFKDLYNQPPDWYEGDFTNFNTILFVNSLSNFNTQATQTVTYSPSSSSSGGGWSGGGGGGGGFSGGGGGGGGGGAW